MTMSIDRIRQVIATSGMNQGEFARAVGLDAPKLSKSLAGIRRFTSSDVARIAELGGVSVDWLLGAPEPVMLSAARRAAGTSSQAATEQASRLVELREIANDLGYPRSFPPISLPTGSPRTSGGQLADQALRIVRGCGDEPTAPDLVGLIERCFGFDVATVDLGEGFDGLSVSGEELRLVLASPSSNPARQRFTLAHELGHLLAGDDQGVHLDQDIYAPSARTDPAEVAANSFAAAFLMPAELLSERVSAGFGEISFATLAMDCSVSPSALAIRLSTLRLIDQLAAERYRRMTVQRAAQLSGRMAELGARTKAASTEGTPQLLAEDLFAAYSAHRTTLRPYAVLLGIDPAELRKNLAESDG
jgi:Zn-dependent peptidase ImmA (M78 family)/transcriptional regulator with XRE-family HTH domain